MFKTQLDIKEIIITCKINISAKGLFMTSSIKRYRRKKKINFL